MAFADSRGTSIFWREKGTGEPLLLIIGLGCTSDLWYRATPELSALYRVISFDNRGVGRSAAPPAPYSISQMAEDALAVLDAAGVESAHVFGYSMGGMIAQELVLRFPERVRSLILGGTDCGGRDSVPAEPRVYEALDARTARTPIDAFRAMAEYVYDDSTPREKIEEDLAVRSRNFPTRAGFLAQLQAIKQWKSFDRLNSITIPTLVIHGKNDKLIPPENADILVKEIPNAKLVKLDDASHTFLTDKSQEAMQAIKSFLASTKS